MARVAGLTGDKLSGLESRPLLRTSLIPLFITPQGLYPMGRNDTHPLPFKGRVRVGMGVKARGCAFPYTGLPLEEAVLKSAKSLILRSHSLAWASLTFPICTNVIWVHNRQRFSLEKR